MIPSKAAARAAARASRTAESLASEDPARLAHLLDWLPERPGILAAYASTADEPGTGELVDALVARGWEVRLPVIARGVAWARFSGWDAVEPRWGGIPSPTGPRLGAPSLADADVVVVSCLAVDRDGYRLGVGGGWYDRALLHRRPGAVVLAWARAAEVVDAVPREPHDVPVDGYVTGDGVTLTGGGRFRQPR